jgi:hypothetical protein
MDLLVVSCATGVFLGLYYKFLVLIPLSLAAAIACSIAALMNGQTVSASLFAIVVPVVGLQGGYMIGLTGRELFSRLVSRRGGVQSGRI